MSAIGLEKADGKERRNMMENTTIKDVVLDKKMDNYNFENNNFLASQELTVTITLAEYRKLVENDATSKQRIKQSDDDKYARNCENTALKEENARLKAELYELQKKLDGEEVTNEKPTESV